MEERPSLGYLEDHCGPKPGSTSGFPFGEGHKVFKVCGRIFAVLHAGESPAKITLKADPDLTVLLRGQYPSVRPVTSTNATGTPSPATEPCRKTR